MTNPSIITRDVDALSVPTNNVYKSISIISKRARQISSTVKEELSGKWRKYKW